MNIANLLVAPHTLRVQSVVVSPPRITVIATSTKARAVCPTCQHLARRIHSHYVRRAADLPWLGIAVHLELRVRRFFCDQASCPQRIFCERVPTLVALHARRTVRLNIALQRVSFALGGEAGARLAADLAMAASADTLLRRIRQAPQPPPCTPRVLGVDDWAKRKGHSYGTILVDLERRAPIDLLPDREAPTLQQWLQTHPGIEVISRDRAPKYAEGARAGAPQAIQVADRWPVLTNLGEVVKRVLTRQRVHIEHATRQLRAHHPGQPGVRGAFPLSLLARPRTEIEQHRAHRYARYCAVKRLQHQGVSQVGIARTLCINHATVRRFMRASTFPERAQYWKGSRLDPYLPYLSRRWVQGVRNPLQLWREIRAQGYPGTARMLERYSLRLGQRLRGLSPQESTQFLQAVLTFPTPSVRQVPTWVQRPPRALITKQRQFLTHLETVSPEVKETRALALAFRQFMKKRLVSQFPSWLTQAERSAVTELRSFAVGLGQEYLAIAAALEYPWSNGPVAGHVNRLKTIKRQLYGRANFDLLKARVLGPASGNRQ